MADGCANASLNKFHLHLPRPQPRHTFTFTASSHKQRSNMNIFWTYGQWMCKHKLEQIPFCTCQDFNPNSFSPSHLLPANKEETLQHVSTHWKQLEIRSCVLHGALILNVPPRFQKQTSTKCVFCLCMIVHATVRGHKAL